MASWPPRLPRTPPISPRRCRTPATWMTRWARHVASSTGMPCGRVLIDPVTGKKRYEESPAATEGTCTMCGKMCAVRTVNKVFEGTTIDLGMED